MKNIILSLLTIITILSLTACGAKVTQTADALTVELGSELDISISDFFTANKPEILSDFLVDTTAVKMNEVGTYNVAVAYKDDRYNIVVNMVDTTAPVVTVKKDLDTYNEEDSIKIKDIVAVDELSEYTVAFLVDNEKVENVIVSEEASEFKIIAEDAYGNTSEVVKVEFNVYVDPFKKSPLNPSVQCTFTKNEGKFNFEQSTYTASQIFVDALHDAVPQLNDYPEAFQKHIVKTLAKNASLFDSEQDVIDNVNESIDLDNYYNYNYEKYGDVKGYKKGTGLYLYELVDSETSGGSGQASVVSSDKSETYTYFDEPTVTINGYDGPVTYTHTGEYIDGKAVYVDEYGKKCHINSQGGYDPLPDKIEDWQYSDGNFNLVNWR